MLRITLLVLIFVGVAAAQSAVSNTTSAAKPACSGNLNQEKPATARAIKAFWLRFRTALRDNDKLRIAGMIAYPLTVGFPSGNLEVSSEQQFLKNYKRIFPKDLRAMLLRYRPECIGRVGVKGFSVAEGQVWFDQYPDGAIRIFTVIPQVYPGD